MACIEYDLGTAAACGMLSGLWAHATKHSIDRNTIGA